LATDVVLSHSCDRSSSWSSTLSLHDALPIWMEAALETDSYGKDRMVAVLHGDCLDEARNVADMVKELGFTNVVINDVSPSIGTQDRKSTRLNSSHVSISYAVFCLKKKKKHTN